MLTVAFKMNRFSSFPHSKGTIAFRSPGRRMTGPTSSKFTWSVLTLTAGVNCPLPLLLPGPVQTVDPFGLTAVFYMDRIAAKGANITQRSASDYKLLRTLKFLSS